MRAQRAKLYKHNIAMAYTCLLPPTFHMVLFFDLAISTNYDDSKENQSHPVKYQKNDYFLTKHRFLEVY